MATIMAWSQCKLEIAKTGEKDSIPTSLTEVVNVKENSVSLESDLGTALEAYASGHKLVAQEYPQETLKLNVTVIEPEDELLELLGIATADSDGTSMIKSHVVSDFFSVKVTPKHKGAKGMVAPKTQITYAPAYSEENGNEATLTFDITKTTEADTNYWYKKFTTTEELS